ncbi:uncharacterized protein FOMMEDRAFT_25831 [Fomitiporia mediterranea MF3/22]|uniref:uncharacterized protein n=1 Tax=Fomitiporia mediterranea (strain MF3/22) TaxID=694068 RepID=UPI00044096CB|nr:uncharacterized protein FOMMEDRAFT_25831 [Fomitiporia mediterranea MF3/22]EJD06591.1 hypothetical protein FOMMEDRAFT_25831 [Fomitiporia mediterranea MF3/22]
MSSCECSTGCGGCKVSCKCEDTCPNCHDDQPARVTAKRRSSDKAALPADRRRSTTTKTDEFTGTYNRRNSTLTGTYKNTEAETESIPDDGQRKHKHKHRRSRNSGDGEHKRLEGATCKSTLKDNRFEYGVGKTF